MRIPVGRVTRGYKHQCDQKGTLAAIASSLHSESYILFLFLVYSGYSPSRRHFLTQKREITPPEAS